MMDIELIQLVESVKKCKCESNYIEIKSAQNGCPKLYDTFSAFSNQCGGGKIIFGMDEDDFEVCGVYDAADLQKRIMEQSLQMEPVIRPLCTVAEIDGSVVVCAEIQEIDNFEKPCFYKGAGRLRGSYVRVGDGDRRMTEYEVYSYEVYRKKIQDELRIVKNGSISDIDTPAYSDYVSLLRDKKPNLAGQSAEKIRQLQGFAVGEKPTLAGVVLFSEYPQMYYPQLGITAVSVPGTEMSTLGSVGERFIDNQRIDGTLVQLLDGALAFVRKNMRTKTIIDSTTGKRSDRTEYPIVAVRELIINALVHRDYSVYTDSTPITIKMFRDRMEIENPGALFGRITLDKLGMFSADTRNPFIANALEIMGETENRYSGIPTVYAMMNEAGLPAPKFESEMGVFRVTLYNDLNSSGKTVTDDTKKEILAFCSVPRSRSEIESLFNGRMTISYVMNKYVHTMVAEGLLSLTMPEKPKSKNQKYVSIVN